MSLDAEQRAGLPEALRRWLRFALARRGVAPEWIDPVVVELDVSLPEFEGAFDDESSWGPAKVVIAELTKRDVDLTDRAAVDDAQVTIPRSFGRTSPDGTVRGRPPAYGAPPARTTAMQLSLSTPDQRRRSGPS